MNSVGKFKTDLALWIVPAVLQGSPLNRGCRVLGCICAFWFFWSGVVVVLVVVFRQSGVFWKTWELIPPEAFPRDGY